MTPLELEVQVKRISPELAGMIEAARLMYTQNVALPMEAPLRHIYSDYIRSGEIMLGIQSVYPGDTIDECRLWLRQQFEISISKGHRHGVYDVLVTPALAMALLEINIGNRQLDARNCTRIEFALVNGEWQLNGQPVIIDRNFTLRDAQNRLTMIVQTGVSALMDIRFGIDPKAFETMDSGKIRRPADVLFIAKEKAVTNLAATVRTIWSIRHGSKVVTSIVDKEHFSNSVARKMTGELSNIDRCVQIGQNTRHKLMGSAAGFAAAAYFISQEYTIDFADKFFTALVSGDLLPGHAVMKFRDNLTRRKHNKKHSDETAIALAANCVLAFNAWLKDRKTFDSWNSEEEFPGVLVVAK